MPVVDPERVSDDLVAALHRARRHHLGGGPCQSSARIFAATRARASRGWRMPASRWSARSVLLKGVNDDVETLAALMRAFVENRIKPYYLHHPDLAPRHLAFPPRHRGRPGADAGIARAAVRPGPADLCARSARRLRQGAAGFAQCGEDRAPAIASAISRATGTTIPHLGGYRRSHARGHLARMSAGDVTSLRCRPCPRSRLKNALTLWRVCSRHTTPMIGHPVELDHPARAFEGDESRARHWARS